MLFPMYAMVLLTLVVGCIALSVRFKSVTSGAVKISYYRNMQGEHAPEYVIRTTRCVNNMFEVPTLFYAAGVATISLEMHSSMLIALAWVFVLFRCLLVVIHLTYNNVLHRMITYWVGLSCVLLMWTVLVFKA